MTHDEFEGGIKPEQAKRHYGEMLAAFRKEIRSSGFTSGKRTGASEHVHRILNGLLIGEDENFEAKKKDAAATEGRESTAGGAYCSSDDVVVFYVMLCFPSLKM